MAICHSSDGKLIQQKRRMDREAYRLFGGIVEALYQTPVRSLVPFEVWVIKTAFIV